MASHAQAAPRPRMSPLRARFPFLFWPLFAHRATVDVTEPSGNLDGHVKSSRFSLRLQRYWWAASKITEEVAATEGEFVVVDLGCEQGWLKRFTRPNPRVRWIGLDGNTDHPSLAASGYDEVVTCNFQQPLPLPDQIADAVVSLHVFEHLHDADFTMGEVQRILKPGGVFLAGTPGAPGPLAAIRTRTLRRRDRMGLNRHWGHVRKFSPGSWAGLCRSAGLTLEFLTGSHLIRKTGSWLENRWVWVRFNQVWGSLFPSLGQELYLSARKPEAGQPVSGPGPLGRVWLRADWAAPLAAAVLGLAAIWQVSVSSPEYRSFSEEIAMHNDGNDAFLWGVRSRSISPETHSVVHQVGYDGTLDTEFDDFETRGQNLNLIVDEDRAAHYLSSPVGENLRVTAVWRDQASSVVVLSMENEGPALQDYLQIGRN